MMHPGCTARSGNCTASHACTLRPARGPNQGSMWPIVWALVWRVSGIPESLRVEWRRMSITPAPNIGTYATRFAERIPDRLALACGEYRATYAEEELRVNALARAL